MLRNHRKNIFSLNEKTGGAKTVRLNTGQQPGPHLAMF
nr:unnamed protein product [Callosobruchus analis]